VGEDLARARIARRHGLLRARRAHPYLDKLGFGLVGFGCTTCIGNSGPLAPEISAGDRRRQPRRVAVLSGNRNFEGRIHPDVRMNYLASPPLVVAYAIAGTMDIDVYNEPLGVRRERRGRLPARPLAERREEVLETARQAVQPDGFTDSYANAFTATSAGRDRGPDRRALRLGRLDLRAQAAVLRRHEPHARAAHRHRRARCLASSATR
jgi:aconitase A